MLACVFLVPFEFPHLHSSLFMYYLFWGSMDMLVLRTDLSRALEMENVVVLSSVREDAEGLVCKVALLKGKLMEAC
jgi:hypothetical protein